MMDDSYARRITEALEKIAAAQATVQTHLEAEEKRAEERMEIMRKIGQEVETGQAIVQAQMPGVTKQ